MHRRDKIWRSSRWEKGDSALQLIEVRDLNVRTSWVPWILVKWNLPLSEDVRQLLHFNNQLSVSKVWDVPDVWCLLGQNKGEQHIVVKLTISTFIVIIIDFPKWYHSFYLLHFFISFRSHYLSPTFSPTLFLLLSILCVDEDPSILQRIGNCRLWGLGNKAETTG